MLSFKSSSSRSFDTVCLLFLPGLPIYFLAESHCNSLTYCYYFLLNTLDVSQCLLMPILPLFVLWLSSYSYSIDLLWFAVMSYLLFLLIYLSLSLANLHLLYPILFLVQDIWSCAQI